MKLGQTDIDFIFIFLSQFPQFQVEYSRSIVQSFYLFRWIRLHLKHCSSFFFQIFSSGPNVSKSNKIIFYYTIALDLERRFTEAPHIFEINILKTILKSFVLEVLNSIKTIFYLWKSNTSLHHRPSHKIPYRISHIILNTAHNTA